MADVADDKGSSEPGSSSGISLAPASPQEQPAPAATADDRLMMNGIKSKHGDLGEDAYVSDEAYDLALKGKEAMHQLGWVKEDFGSKVSSFVDQSFVAKASGLSPAELSTW